MASRMKNIVFLEGDYGDGLRRVAVGSGGGGGGTCRPRASSPLPSSSAYNASIVSITAGTMYEAAGDT
ncbi:MAG: hypothetical protein GSR84_02720 [Desulfurococcales archaeon]|nr:hypothetical protein [Desulfurococcales archaeon]